MTQKKEMASALWENLNRGLDALYQKYKSLKDEKSAAYDEQIAGVAPEYKALKDRASTQHKIAQANLDRKLSEKGLGSSGESVRREALTGAAFQQSLTDLELQKEKQTQELKREKEDALSRLDTEESEKTGEYVYKMNLDYFDALNAEKETALAEEKLQIQKEQNAFDREYKQAELALKKDAQTWEMRVKEALNNAQINYYNARAKAESEKQVSSSGRVSESAFSPEGVTARQLVGDIVDRHTETDHMGQKVEDTKKIKSTIATLLADKALSDTYRYELYLYAKALGYA